MKITGPFLDRKKKQLGQEKTWYLRFRAPRVGANGAPLVDAKGNVVYERQRPYYASREKAIADKPRLEAQYATAGAGAFVRSRAAQEEYERAKEILGDEVSLVDAANYFRSHHPKGQILMLEKAVSDCVGRIKLRVGETRHWSDLKVRLKLFAEAFSGRIFTSITRREVLAWLYSLRAAPYELSPRSVLNYKTAVCTLYNDIIAANELTIANPAAGIKRKQLPKIIRKEVEFLMIEDTVRYLRAAEFYDPEMVAAEVVQLFAGVRSDDEMDNFSGDFVHAAAKEIIIPADVAKIGVRQPILGIEENFWTWWARYGRKGLLRCTNYTRRWLRIRILAAHEKSQADRLAQIPVKVLTEDPQFKPILEDWPWNGRRRTFCTYHVAKHQSADRTKLLIRHQGTAATLEKSYRGLGVTQAQGVAYFAILPLGQPQLQAAAPAEPAQAIPA